MADTSAWPVVAFASRPTLFSVSCVAAFSRGRAIAKSTSARGVPPLISAGSGNASDAKLWVQPQQRVGAQTLERKLQFALMGDDGSQTYLCCLQGNPKSRWRCRYDAAVAPPAPSQFVFLANQDCATHVCAQREHGVGTIIS